MTEEQKKTIKAEYRPTVVEEPKTAVSITPPVPMKTSNFSSANDNQIGSLIRTIGIVYIALTVLGGLIIMADFGFIIGMLSIFASSFAGIMLMGFAEIINLLQDIKNANVKNHNLLVELSKSDSNSQNNTSN